MTYPSFYFQPGSRNLIDLPDGLPRSKVLLSLLGQRRVCRISMKGISYINRISALDKLLATRPTKARGIHRHFSVHGVLVAKQAAESLSSRRPEHRSREASNTR